MAAPRRPRPSGLLVLLPGLLLPLAGAFNLDVDSPAEYSGPEGSYFGFAVDFFVPSESSHCDDQSAHVVALNSCLIFGTLRPLRI